MTSPTGASVQSPRSKPRPAAVPRPVMPATSPYRSLHSTSSNRGTAPGTGASATSSALPIHALDLRAERPQALVDALVASLDLAHVVDRARPFGRQRREQHRHPGPNVGRFDGPALERRGPRN